MHDVVAPVAYDPVQLGEGTQLGVLAHAEVAHRCTVALDLIGDRAGVVQHHDVGLVTGVS